MTSSGPDAKAARAETRAVARLEKERRDEARAQEREEKRKAKAVERERQLEAEQETKESRRDRKLADDQQAKADKTQRSEQRLHAKEQKREQKAAALVPRPHGIESIRSRRMLELLEQNRSPDEVVEAVILSHNGGLVALQERLLIVKVGMMAGSTGGGRVSSYRYQDVVGLQTNTGLVNGTLVVQTAGVNTSPGDFWATWRGGQANRNDDPFKLPNVLPITKQTLTVHALDLERVRELIRRAGTASAIAPTPPPTAAPAPTSPASTTDLAEQLSRLAELHRSGALDDAEFEAAKRRVIGG